jgi:DHA1 family bicyclomycin/chloramphenicol resistance-like MFS transporter
VLKLPSPAAVVVLAALTALGPLATDMYLPALPAIAEGLGAGADQVQLTLSVYMAGFALTQLLCGPLADRYGRRPLLLGGMSIFCLASVLCALSPNIELLLVGRFLQAFGGAVGPVLGRAAVRDIYEPRQAGRIMAYMASTMALAPALAPIVGGMLLVFFGWASVFVLLAIYAAVMVAVVALILPEPLPLERRQSIHPYAILANFRMLLGQRVFLGYTLTNATAFSGLFAFLSGSSFVLIEFLGVAPTAYGFYFAIGVGGFLTGSILGGRLSPQFGTDRLIVIGAVLCAMGGGAMALLAWLEVFAVLAVVLPHALFMAGIGILMPQSMAGALAHFPYCAGSASSLFGFLQMTLAAGVGAAVGQFHDGTSRTMASAIALAGITSLLSYLWLVRGGARQAVLERRPQRG